MNADHINYGSLMDLRSNGDDHMETDANDPTSITEPTNQETLPHCPASLTSNLSEARHTKNGLDD